MFWSLRKIKRLGVKGLTRRVKLDDRTPPVTLEIEEEEEPVKKRRTSQRLENKRLKSIKKSI